MANNEVKTNMKEQVKQLTDRLSEGIKELFAGDKYAEYLRTLPKMYRYSPRNALLIQMQMPGATLVAGYQAWQTKYGRYVKQGERGIKILAPSPFTVKQEKQKIDPDTAMPVFGSDGLPETEVVEHRIARFKTTTVFDVSQTDGKPLPTLVEDLIGDVSNYELFLEALRDVSPLPIVFEPLPPDTDGVCRFGDRISIRPGMSEIQTISAVIHEITHAKLHDKELQNENAEPKDRSTREVEAESVSYVVCQHYGIETGANSFGYVANWSKSRELKELSASLDTIHSAATELMTGIDAAFRRLAQERGMDLGVSADAPAREAEYEPVSTETTTEIFEPNEIFTQYADLVTTVVMNDKAYEPFRTGDDIAAARSASDAAIARAVTGLITLSPEHIPLAKEYIENPKFQKQLGYHVFLKTHIEPRASEKTVEAEREAEAEQPTAPRDISVAKDNFETFEDLFPQIISGEYRYMRLEAGAGMEPLSIERIGRERISIMHSYTMNGDTMYDPMMVFTIDRETRTLIAAEYEMSMPPLYQRVDENGDGQSIDGNGRESTIHGLQKDLDDFMSQWLDNIGQQGYYPVLAKKVIDGADVEISFDDDRNPLTQDAPPQTEISESVKADESFTKKANDLIDEISEAGALIGPQERELIARYAEHVKNMELVTDLAIEVYDAQFEYDHGHADPKLRLRIEQDFKTENLLANRKKQYELGYGYKGNGLTFWNRLEESNGDYTTVAHIDSTRAVTFYDEKMPDSMRERIEDIALYYDPMQSVSQNQRVFHTPPQEYKLNYHDIPVYGVEVYNPRGRLVANILDTGAVRYIDRNIPASAIAEIEAAAKARAEKREAEFINGEGDAFGVYLFEPRYDEDTRIVKENYRLAYFGSLENGETLDTIRERFATDQQPYYEYHARENGVPFGASDIIVMKQDGVITPWYMDNLAFSKQNDFYRTPGTEAEKTPDTPAQAPLPDGQIETPDAKEPDSDAMPPDPSLCISDMLKYGYLQDDIVPLSKERALELFDAGLTVYLLKSDNTEELAFEHSEISDHSGLFGVVRDEWLSSEDYKRMKQEAASAESSLEAALLYGEENLFGIYQLKENAPRECRWASFDELKAAGFDVDRSNYELVHTAPLTIRDAQTNLHKIFADYNTNPPEDFKGHSPSMSDVIVLQWRGNVSAHYIDRIGFEALPAFTGAEGQQRETAQEKDTPADYTSSQLGNTMKPAQTKPPVREPSKPTALPQNEGNPTVAEITAKANAGESISLSELIKAIKREKLPPAKPRAGALSHNTERGIV